MAQLSLRGIKKRFKSVEVLHGIDLDVKDRELIVFVGRPVAEIDPSSPDRRP